ncbi:MAG TPA: nucleotidyltransferase family protein [Aliiroseovarius sp.]|nr:nucleotidyltransferase family protein [Aliiroseovarius sp.]
MNAHRFAGAPEADLRQELERLIRATPFLIDTLARARAMGLPDCWLVSGALYNRVWNALTGRPARHGIKDLDLFYFDPDTSWEAEDRMIRKAAEIFAPAPPVELRNQARVHLWYEAHFGEPYAPLGSSREGVDRFACKTHAVAARLRADDRLEIYAPYGLADIFALRVVPNTMLNNRATHEAKAARQSALWPELEIVPWPDAP